MLLMIDNYDSFTFNLVQYFGELGAEVKVVRNDEIDIAGIEGLAPDQLVISPGLAIWILPLPSVQPSFVMASCPFRRAQALWPIRCPVMSGMRP